MSVFIMGPSPMTSYSVMNPNVIEVNFAIPLQPGSYVLQVYTNYGQAKLVFSPFATLAVNGFPLNTKIGPGDTLTLSTSSFIGNYSGTLMSKTCGTVSSYMISQSLNQAKFVIFSDCQGDNQMYMHYQPEGSCQSADADIGGITFDATPVISSVDPLTARKGDTVTIKGKYFNIPNNPALPEISFGGVKADTVIKVANNILKAVVGAGASGDILLKNALNVSSTYTGFTFVDTAKKICPGSTITLTSNWEGIAICCGYAYYWQVDDGTGFKDLSDGLYYSGVHQRTLTISNIPSSFAGYKYRCLTNVVYSFTHTINFVNTFLTTATNHNWENATSWSCGTVPDAYTDVVIDGPVVVNINSNKVCRSLTLKNGASLNVLPGVHLTILY
ncbi:IPT/TIG domain-containing protein [Ferruginibacter lapsinanis]|uniref:IPT/TIG domain-containing protein n=1 Tax=Ferruginibacter lapsinanis TaxID=563172 RepID=UPI001E4FEE8E|nr:IPT/TIG domain-containing protein [Ferruginibacter lapsinanis]UEG49297.1 IPT/TIG domain-containing protein [Ferruginibacter lapsinanis]